MVPILNVSRFENHRDPFKMGTIYRDTQRGIIFLNIIILFWYECVRRKHDIEMCRELATRKRKTCTIYQDTQRGIIFFKYNYSFLV